MVYKFRDELGNELFEEVIQLSLTTENKQAYRNFKRSKLDIIKATYDKYKGTKINTQPLLIFLSYYSIYNNKPEIFDDQNLAFADVTKSYGYTEIVVDKYPGDIIP